MINVGINNNLVITEVGKNDKGTLVIKVKETTEIDPIAALNAAGSANFNKGEKDFMFYPPKAEAFAGGVDTVENIMKKIAEVKDPLDQILRQYTTSNNIKWDIFVGTGIDGTNLRTKVLEQSSLDKIYDNIANQFIKMFTPFAGEAGKKMRFIFIRQSKAKHYPSIRKRFLESNPFIESMEVPAEQSKLKFSNYEMTNGLASGDAVSGQQTVTEEERSNVATLFTAN